MIPTECLNCKNSFLVKPSWVKAGYGKYCSPTCRNMAARKGKLTKCDVCGTDTYKSLKALRGSKSGKFFCSKSCQTKWRNVHFSMEKHPNWKNGHNAYRNLMLREKVPQFCRLCQTGDIRILAAHHIDQNHFNHDIENLAWLCHNCHHLVHHYPDEYEKFMATIV